MNCLRCGRETQEDHVFCESCREQMEKYPVRPGTAVLLPRRREEPHPRKQKRHIRTRPSLSPEEQIRKLRRQRTGLLVSTLLFLTLLGGMVTLSLWDRDSEEGYRPGQNYSTMDPDELSGTP